MPVSEQFVKVIGKMPFTAKHGVRWCYIEATRAALRSDESIRRHFARRLGAYALCNDIMLLAGAGMSYFSVKYGVEHHNPIFIAEAAGAALYAAGHGASGIAQHMMVRRHNRQATAIAARHEAALPPPATEPPTLPEVAPVAVTHQSAKGQTVPAYTLRRPTSPTLTERLVTDGGTAVAFIPLVHMTLNDVVLPFIQH